MVRSVLISIRLPVSAARGQNQLQLRLKSSLCPAGTLPTSGGFIKHSGEFAIIFTLLRDLNKDHCLTGRGELKQPLYNTSL